MMSLGHPARPQSSTGAWGALLIFAIGIAVAGVTRSFFPFDGLYGQDAFAYFRFARAIVPHFSSGTPLPDLYWPRGYPAIVAMLLPLVGGSPVAGQLVSALACGWAASATFLIVQSIERQCGGIQTGGPRARTSGGFTAATVAGLSVACSGAALRTSQVVMADGLAMAFAATAMLSAVRYAEARSGPVLVACAASVALGTTTRWLVALLALPIGLALLYELRQRAGNREQRPNAVWFLLAVSVALAVLAPQLIVAHAVPMSFAHHEWLTRWSPIHALRRDFHTQEGIVHYRLPVAIFYLVRLAWPDYLFPTVAVLALGGLYGLWRLRRKSLFALIVGWPIVAWAFISGIPYENPRFLLPTLPAMAVLAGIGWGILERSVSIRLRRLALAGLLVSLAVGLGLGAREHARMMARKNADVDLVRWTDAHVPPEATLLMCGGTLVFEAYGSTRVRDIYLATLADVQALFADPGPFYYLEDPVEVDLPKWSGLAPQQHWRALRLRPGLTAVAVRAPYTLFRVGPR